MSTNKVLLWSRPMIYSLRLAKAVVFTTTMQVRYELLAVASLQRT